MPLMVLTAASISLVIGRLDLFGAGAGQAGADVDRRRVGARHQVESELAIREPAEDDERRAHHHGEDRPLDADFREFHCPPPPCPACPPRRPPPPPCPRPPCPRPPPPLRPLLSGAELSTVDADARRQLVEPIAGERFIPLQAVERFPTALPGGRRESTFCCVILPSLTMYTEETPANVETALSDTARTFSSRFVRMTPLAKKPGLRRRSSSRRWPRLETCASSDRARD